MSAEFRLLVSVCNAPQLGPDAPKLTHCKNMDCSVPMQVLQHVQVRLLEELQLLCELHVAALHIAAAPPAPCTANPTSPPSQPPPPPTNRYS